MGQTDFEFGYNDPSNRDYRTDDPPDYQQACMGMMVCPHCSKAVFCSDTANLAPIGEQDDMIPRGNQTFGDDGNSRGRGRGKKRTGLRYLSADMLSTTHQVAEIIGARTQDDNFGKDRPQVVVVKLRLKGEFILWTLRVNNPALEELGNKFGDDETAWKDRQIELYLEEDNFDGKQWIRCEAVNTPTTTSKRGK